MVSTLTKAVQRVGKMTTSRQREVARFLNIFASQDTAGVSLTKSQVSEVRSRIAAKPKYASDMDVTKFFSRLGL